VSSLLQIRCAVQENERRGTEQHRVYPVRYSSGGLAEGLPSNLIVKQINETIIVHRKCIIYCSCANALFSAQAGQ